MIDHEVKLVMPLVTRVALLQQGNLALSGESAGLDSVGPWVAAIPGIAHLREPRFS